MHELPTGTVTFLFTDIEGSTERWEHHRTAMQSALEQHDALLRVTIETHRGYVFKTVGDAFCAAFHTPLDALSAAIDAQRAVTAEDWSGFGPGFPPIRLRMGIHTGVAQVRGGDYFGPAVNRSARLEAAGHGGQVLLSAATYDGVKDRLPAGVRLRDLGEHRLRDLRHSERISQVVIDGLPDDTRAPRTAGELQARDRIVIRDPDDADPDAVAEVRLVVARSVPETLADLAAVIRGDARTVVLTPEQLRLAARHRAKDLEAYRLGRIAEWSQPRYRLDGRFVGLTLLVDQGEEAAGGRWAAHQERYDDLGELLAAVSEPAVVVLGPPGSGKSTLLRHRELDAAIDGLRGEAPVTFFAQFNQYRPAAPQDPLPSPERWLSDHWAARYPDLPPLDSLLAAGRMILLLDAFNEIPAGSEREFRQRVGLWKDWLVRLAHVHPGNRVVFSCRTLDYSAPLSTPALRVPQVQIEPLSDAQVEAFLRAYSPVRGGDIWSAIAGTPQLDTLRAPFFLALLVDQVEATGDVAGDRAGLFTGFVRQSLKREVERGSALFALEELLTSRDMRRIAQWQWRDAYELPERGGLVPGLAALAYGMQETEADGGASQVRVDYDRALHLVDHPHDEMIVKAGVSIAVLDEDPAADEVLYRHQLIQEYFAARVLAREPRPELARAPWRAADIRPSVRELIDTLPPVVEMPGGVYPIGDDEPIAWELTGVSGSDTGHVPRPRVALAAFRVAQFPVTNAEWACFVAAGGYADERWWDSAAGQAWRRGELANEGAKANSRYWREQFQESPELFDRMVDEGRFASDDVVERWRKWLGLDHPGFEAALGARWPAKQETEPRYWQDERWNSPSQPVVGICWYEARAYCTWLGAQSGVAFRLPTEVEIEAAARGQAGRRYGHGESFDALKGNTIATRLRRTSPVGVFVEGDTPEGLSDMNSNVALWTASLWGASDEEPQYTYPYVATDGREVVESPAADRRVVRGASWLDVASYTLAASRFRFTPDARHDNVGVRVALDEWGSPPRSSKHSSTGSCGG